MFCVIFIFNFNFLLCFCMVCNLWFVSCGCFFFGLLLIVLLSSLCCCSSLIGFCSLLLFAYYSPPVVALRSWLLLAWYSSSLVVPRLLFLAYCYSLLIVAPCLLFFPHCYSPWLLLLVCCFHFLKVPLAPFVVDVPRLHVVAPCSCFPKWYSLPLLLKKSSIWNYKQQAKTSNQNGIIFIIIFFIWSFLKFFIFNFNLSIFLYNMI